MLGFIFVRPFFLAGSCSVLVSASSVGLCHSPKVLALQSPAPFYFLSVPLVFCFFCLCACSPVFFYALISSSVVSQFFIALSSTKAASSQLFYCRVPCWSLHAFVSGLDLSQKMRWLGFVRLQRFLSVFGR